MDDEDEDEDEDRGRGRGSKATIHGGITTLLALEVPRHLQRLPLLVGRRQLLAHAQARHHLRAAALRAEPLVHLLALRVEWWGEWIPSKANVADIETRPERVHELLEGLSTLGMHNVTTYEEYELPPLDMGAEKLRQWMREVRAAGERAAQQSA